MVNQMMTPVHMGSGMPVRMMASPGAGRPQQPHILCLNPGTYHPQLVSPSSIAVTAAGAEPMPLPAGFQFQMTPQPQYWMMPPQLQMAVATGGVQRSVQSTGAMASHMFPGGWNPSVALQPAPVQQCHGFPLVRQVHSLGPLPLGVQQRSVTPIAPPMPTSKTKVAPPTMTSPGVGPWGVGLPAGPRLVTAVPAATASTMANPASGGPVASAAADAGAPASGQWQQEISQESESCRSGRPAEFPCTHAGCQEVFSRPSQLNKHAYIHTGDRPFGCTVCGQGFRTKWTLKKHGRTHTGEKPFSCEDCNRCVGFDITSRLYPTSHAPLETCAVCYALLGARADRVLIGAWNSML